MCRQRPEPVQHEVIFEEAPGRPEDRRAGARGSPDRGEPVQGGVGKRGERRPAGWWSGIEDDLDTQAPGGVLDLQRVIGDGLDRRLHAVDDRVQRRGADPDGR